MAAKHTPGPWKTQSIENQRHVWGPDGDCIVSIHNGSLPDDERKANARLIAAAPDLLEACEAVAELAEILKSSNDPSQNRRAATAAAAVMFSQKVRNAIAKARGEI